MAKIAPLLLLLAFAPVLMAVLPGVMVQVNHGAINKFLLVGVDILNKLIPGTHLPDTSGRSAPESKSVFSWRLSNMYIREFHMDPAHTGDTLNPPDTVGLGLSNVHVHITANYHIQLGSGWLSISKDGTIDASTNDASASASVDVFAAGNGDPALRPHSCGSDIGHLDITFHGGIIDDIIDLFKGAIEGYVKGQIDGVICSQLTSIITNEANNYLKQIPLSIALPDPMNGFYIDYGLTQNPVCQPNYIELLLRAKFWFSGHENDAGIPQAHGTIGPCQGSQDLCLNFDAQEIFGSFAYAIQMSPFHHLNIDQDLLGGLGDTVKRFMRCHCDDDHFCIGTVIPQIAAHCPANGVIDVSADATDVISFIFNSTGAFGDLAATASFHYHVPPSTDGPELFHVTINADLEVPSDLHFEGWSIKGHALVTGATLKLGASSIGDIDDSAIDKIWETVLKLVVEQELNRPLAAGIPLPKIPYVNLINTHIGFEEYALRLSTDVQYTG